MRLQYTHKYETIRTKKAKNFILILFTFSLSSQYISLSFSLRLILSSLSSPLYSLSQPCWSHHTNHHAMPPSLPYHLPRYRACHAIHPATPPISHRVRHFFSFVFRWWFFFFFCVVVVDLGLSNPPNHPPNQPKLLVLDLLPLDPTASVVRRRSRAPKPDADGSVLSPLL